ncbi:MAG: YfiR family protein [Verrucomicrobiota bacterium]
MTFILKCHPAWFARRRSPVLWLWPLLLAALLGCLPARSQEARPPDYEVKAAFLYHFGQFVEWPTNVFADTNAPLVIGVVGDDPFHGDLERMVAGQNINGRPIVVRPVRALPDLKTCQILFIAASQKAQMRELLKAVEGAGVLTVGETGDFIQAGGMINFIIENSEVHFQINNNAARAAGLNISSKLIKLGRSG